jgi:radical SAM superfamily enzyme YgiQ (UPF0313 family)
LPAEPFVRVLLIDFNPFMPPVTPISLGNLGAVLRSLGHQVGILSLGSTSRFGLRDLQGHLEEVAPRLVGFGTYQRNIFQVRAVARMVREVVPEASVVIGGPQATFLPDAALERMPEVDHVSRGEGELAIKAIVEAIDGGTEQAPIPGVTSRTREGEIVTGKAPRQLSLALAHRCTRPGRDGRVDLADLAGVLPQVLLLPHPGGVREADPQPVGGARARGHRVGLQGRHGSAVVW